MALTEDETYGTVVPGFVTDLNGNLSVTTDDTDAAWRGGKWLCDPDGRLVVTTDDSGAGFEGGFLKAPSGAVVVSTDAGASGVIPGFHATPEGALCVTNDPGDAALDTGLFRVDGSLAVTGLGGGGGALYEESFTADDGGWVSAGDNDTTPNRNTFQFQSGPASLNMTFGSSAGTWISESPMFAVDGANLDVSLWIISGDLTGGDITIAISFCDSEGNGESTELIDEVGTTASWTEITAAGVLNTEASTHAKIFLASADSHLDDPFFNIDTILVTEAA